MSFIKSFFTKPKKYYYSSSEAVSSAHPDRLCDDIAAIIIQDIQATDGPCSHAAIEVFATHDSIVIGGEATTSLPLDNKYLRKVITKAFQRVGYIPEMRQYWSKSEVALASNLELINKIAPQSPDIAMGTTDKGENSGWNDQGVYFSSSERYTSNHLGTPHMIATRICEQLQGLSRDTILHPESYRSIGSEFVLGPDNKSVITVKVEENGYTPVEVTAITIAVPHSSATPIEAVRATIKNCVTKWIEAMYVRISPDCQWVINGTGRYVSHGPIADTSMTGRKISVNHPSAGPVWCNKMIGGGALSKPAHASDLILNITARYIANVVVSAGLSDWAVVGCAGAIGRQGVQSLFIKGDNTFEDNSIYNAVIKYFEEELPWAPIPLAKKFKFFDPFFDFGFVVDKNFFGHPELQPWESPELIEEEALKLRKYLNLEIK